MPTSRQKTASDKHMAILATRVISISFPLHVIARLDRAIK